MYKRQRTYDYAVALRAVTTTDFMTAEPAYLLSLIHIFCTYVVLAVSLNLTVGILGELSLGHAGFMLSLIHI